MQDRVLATAEVRPFHGRGPCLHHSVNPDLASRLVFDGRMQMGLWLAAEVLLGL